MAQKGDLLPRLAGKILSAYPYRLKRLLFVNTPNNLPLVSELTDLVKRADPDVLVETIGELDDLTRYISANEREKKYGGSLANLVEYWPIHTTNRYEDTESSEFERTEYESVVNDPGFFEEPDPPLCDFSHSKCIIY